MPKLFVFIQGPIGPSAQVWAERLTNSKGELVVPVLFECVLGPDDEQLSLDQLILKFKDKVENEKFRL